MDLPDEKVNPKSPKNGSPNPIGEPAMIAGSLLGVISIGTVTSKIAWEDGEVGDAPNVTAQFTPILLGLTVWVPFPEKLPVMVLAEHGATPAAGTWYCSVAGTARSVPSLFNTVNGSEILAATWPGESAVLRVGSA